MADRIHCRECTHFTKDGNYGYCDIRHGEGDRLHLRRPSHILCKLFDPVDNFDRDRLPEGYGILTVETVDNKAIYNPERYRD